MNGQPDQVSITIDNRPLQVRAAMTILQAAEQHEIYIPSLCAHKDLTPFGGCRLCIVEVEGMRGFPTACTTPVQDGMVVRTQTAQIHQARSEILQLILSEHPISCLICDEAEECKQYNSTIRKAGVTTGCRYCPNDGQCELHQVAERMGIKEIGYPILYRNLRVEKEDPFYDRDYNLCILCGRCVRICQEIRTAGTLAFKQRGRQTVIGPAYNRSHFDSGCEFCGACVSVCPTGALSEKYRKWQGKPERETVTTCSFCGVGCQLRLLSKGNEIIGSLPADDSLVNNGQLCVKGRFCIAELVNHHKRLKKPYKNENGTAVELSWEKAIELAAERIAGCTPDEFGMLVSPNLTNEDLYIAQKFTRVVTRTHNIDTSARAFYGPGFEAYLELSKMAVPLMDLRKASAILCIGLDTRFGRSVVGVELRRAARRGAKVITINARDNNLSLIAEKWLQPEIGGEARLLEAIVELTAEERPAKSRYGKAKHIAVKEEAGAVALILREASAPVILLGSEFLDKVDSSQILELIGRLARNIRAGIMPLPAPNNLFGSILMGAYPEILPGGFCALNENRLKDLSARWETQTPPPNLKTGARDRQPKIRYLIGEPPVPESPPADFVIYQNIFPPDTAHKVDLVLPSAAFAEVDGTFINGEGRFQRVRKAVEAPGRALPDWMILCMIAKKMGAKGFDFADAREIHDELSSLGIGFHDFEDPERRPANLKFEGQIKSLPPRVSQTKKPNLAYPLLLSTSIIEHSYRGSPLSRWVEGLRKLYPMDILDMNPDDALKASVFTGDEIIVSGSDFEKILVVNVVDDQPAGTLQATLSAAISLEANPYPVRVRKNDV